MPLADADIRRIAENYARVHGEIAGAARAAGRVPDAVKLVAVTKYVDADTTRALVDAGCRDLGESRPQSLWDKADNLADLSPHWHLIGHLQRNKIRRTLPLVDLIHSADSWRLLEAINTEAAQIHRRQAVLIEVNVAGEEAKSGLPVAEVAPLFARLPELRHVEVQGLMTMAPLEGGADAARRTFAALRRLAEQFEPDCPPGVSLSELSMGMSGDFREAIAEGATLVRVGSALFEGIAP